MNLENLEVNNIRKSIDFLNLSKKNFYLIYWILNFFGFVFILATTLAFRSKYIILQIIFLTISMIIFFP
ncbi:hypothetical protein [[Mycoplasma] collis]|uniref:hypothetical protein n=1 Tax=[Mycoplasma] collis TaxID=2127 RepID=UPI00051AC35D|nr:hypothetical protein [[Mycoplasma] collis]